MDKKDINYNQKNRKYIYFNSSKAEVRASIFFSLDKAVIYLEEKNGMEWIKLFGDGFELTTPNKLIEDIVKMYKKYLKGKEVENKFIDLFDIYDSEGKKSIPVLEIPEGLLNQDDDNIDFKEYELEFDKINIVDEEIEFLNPVGRDLE